MSVRSLAVNAFFSTVAHILGRGSLVLVGVFLARNLQPADFAAYNYFQLTVSMVATYSALGLGVTASKFFAAAGGSPPEKKPPIGTLWASSVLAGALIGVGLVLFPTHWLDGGLNVSPVLLSFGVVAVVFGVVPSGGVQGLECFKESTLVASIAATVLIVGALLASSNGSLFFAMSAFIIAAGVQATGNIIIILKRLSFEVIQDSFVFTRKAFSEIGSFAGPMLGVSIVSASGSWVAGRLILDVEGHEGFALYTIGLQWYALALFLPGMIARVILPRLVRGGDNQSEVERKKLICIGGALAGGAAMFVAVVGSLLSPYLISLYGDVYSSEKWLVAAFLMAAVPLAPANTLGNAILAHDGQWAWFLVVVIGFISMLSIVFLFLDLGAFAGALAHGLSSLLVSILAFAILRRRGVL